MMISISGACSFCGALFVVMGKRISNKLSEKVTNGNGGVQEMRKYLSVGLLLFAAQCIIKALWYVLPFAAPIAGATITTLWPLVFIVDVTCSGGLVGWIWLFYRYIGRLNKCDAG